MGIEDVLRIISALVPAIGFSTAVIGLILFVRYKGTMTALNDAVSVYQKLAEGYKQEAECLQKDITELKNEITDLKQKLQIQTAAFDKLTEQFIRALKYEGDFAFLDRGEPNGEPPHSNK